MDSGSAHQPIKNPKYNEELGVGVSSITPPARLQSGSKTRFEIFTESNVIFLDREQAVEVVLLLTQSLKETPRDSPAP